MLYVKNLPAWERAVRLVASLAMATCAIRFWGHLLGVIFALLAVYNTLTAIFGFCPACALAGRRPQSKVGSSSRP
jgi:hypothetical protein